MAVSGTTGQVCPQSGIYRSTCCGVEIALSRNDRFPPCQRCDRATTWILVRPTNP